VLLRGCSLWQLVDRDESLLLEMERLLALDTGSGSSGPPRRRDSPPRDRRQDRRRDSPPRSSGPEPRRDRGAAWRADLDDAMRRGAPSRRDAGGRRDSPPRGSRDRGRDSPPRSGRQGDERDRSRDRGARDGSRDGSRALRDGGGSTSAPGSKPDVSPGGNKPPFVEREDGSWDCPACGNHNYASRQSCNMKICGAAKPPLAAAPLPRDAPPVQRGRDDRDRFEGWGWWGGWGHFLRVRTSPLERAQA
jgi:hypothetical protein